MEGKRLYELDLFRFVAASAVLLYHYSFHGYSAGDHQLTTVSYLAMAPVTKYGFLGVNLFFLISGFVILMTAAEGSLWKFGVSRATRLYPTFWICCSLTFAASLLIGHNGTTVTFRQFLANLTMLSGLRQVPQVDGVYWSLLVEWRFYFLVSLALAAGLIGRVNLLLGVWLGLYVVLTARPIHVLSALVIPEWGPYFIAGAMFYLVWREGMSWYRGSVIALCYVITARAAAASVQRDAVFYHTPFSSAVVCVVLAACYGVMLLMSLDRTAPLSSRRWVRLGALTYPLYLLHQYLGYWLLNLGAGRLNVHLLFWAVVGSMYLLAQGVTSIDRAISPSIRAFLLARSPGPRRVAPPPDIGVTPVAS